MLLLLRLSRALTRFVKLRDNKMAKIVRPEQEAGSFKLLPM